MLVNMKEILAAAQNGHYAVGLFNTPDLDMMQGVIEAAEAKKSPVIIGPAEVQLPYGSLAHTAAAQIAAARRAKVPVCVHFDHGYSFSCCVEAMQLGYTSIMYDASMKEFAANIAETAEMVKFAHAMGVTVEGEVGHVGRHGLSAAEAGEEGDCDDCTTASDAAEFCSRTGVDALAVAIGTVHGVYKSKPNLNIARLAEIRKATDCPLVLHGGSGLSVDDFKATVREGIAKVNYFTDLSIAADRAAKEAFAAGKTYLDVRNCRVDAIRSLTMEKIELFGCVGKA